MTNQGHSPLYLAAKGFHRSAVSSLIQAGCQLTFTDLVVGSAKTCLELLVEEGAPLDARDHGGRTLLHWAVWEGKARVVNWLLEICSDLLALTDLDGWTALHYAAKENRLDLTKVLLDRGADANRKDKWGNSSKHYTTDSLLIKLLEDGGRHRKKTMLYF